MAFGWSLSSSIKALHHSTSVTFESDVSLAVWLFVQQRVCISPVTGVTGPGPIGDGVCPLSGLGIPSPWAPPAAATSFDPLPPHPRNLAATLSRIRLRDSTNGLSILTSHQSSAAASFGLGEFVLLLLLCNLGSRTPPPFF
ncbi:hypothetical protein PGT21_035308 [Puccinia graminis f. sp. tritici]|uniref:Uncharacterized protein n=1 Tax=Puccinia graminis f. sp. tritici TaxID=56615 RepID=A0A5B0QCZ1_PUCGR|nr:hypothetical protein PGT21_035308 [Puccinia graminis f. sp. tritici]